MCVCPAIVGPLFQQIYSVLLEHKVGYYLSYENCIKYSQAPPGLLIIRRRDRCLRFKIDSSAWSVLYFSKMLLFGLRHACDHHVGMHIQNYINKQARPCLVVILVTMVLMLDASAQCLSHRLSFSQSVGQHETGGESSGEPS